MVKVIMMVNMVLGVKNIMVVITRMTQVLIKVVINRVIEVVIVTKVIMAIGGGHSYSGRGCHFNK